MAELLRHPEALRKVQKEVRRIVGSKARVTRDDLAKINYLKAVLKESMRLHPSVPLIPRASIQDFKWMAFGGGRRRCPGEAFGMALVEYFVLASLYLDFDWALPGAAKGTDLDMTEFIALDLHGMHPLVVVPSPSSS